MKFPRGKLQSDFDIVDAEAKVSLAARGSGLIVSGACVLEKHALFLERFDRVLEANGRVRCLGLESFYSALGSTIFGEFRHHEEFMSLIARYSTEPETDLAEYLARDLLARMIGNTDNHGRNSSFLKDGKSVRLAPLYDMAPMAWDSEGIVRSTRWKQENENWIPSAQELLSRHKLNSQKFASACIERSMGLQKFWLELKRVGGCEIFVKHGITQKMMATLVDDFASKVDLFQKGM